MSEHDPFHWRDAARYRPEVNDPDLEDLQARRPTEEPRPERTATDDERIAQGIVEAHERGDEVIDDRTARIIASQLHLGQASEMYSFASTGSIDKDELIPEIVAASMDMSENDVDQVPLNALYVYVMVHEDRDAVPGWHEATRW